MKYYSETRITYSMLATLITPFLVFATATIDIGLDTDESLLWGLISAVVLFAILLPKIWWNFLLDRIRELSKAIKDTD